MDPGDLLGNEFQSLDMPRKWIQLKQQAPREWQISQKIRWTNNQSPLTSTWALTCTCVLLSHVYNTHTHTTQKENCEQAWLWCDSRSLSHSPLIPTWDRVDWFSLPQVPWGRDCVHFSVFWFPVSLREMCGRSRTSCSVACWLLSSLWGVT